MNMQLSSVGDTVFGLTKVTVDLRSDSSAGSILQTDALEVLGKTEMRAAVKIELPDIDNNLVKGFLGVAPSVFVVGDRVAEAAAAAAAAAAANASAAKSVTLKDLDGGTGRNRLGISTEPLSGVKVQLQGGTLVIASGTAAASPAPVPTVAATSAAVVKADVELVLSPTSNAAASAAPVAVAAPLAAPAISGAGAGAPGSSFVQVRTFDPLVVPAASSFSFALPADAFVHKDPQMAVSVVAQTPAGDPLPDWLKFSPTDKRFTGVAPQGVTKLEVMVKAVDANGIEVTTTITLQFSAQAQ